MKKLFLIASCLALVFTFSAHTFAAGNGTATGTIKGPHGEVAAGLTYTFTNKTTGVSVAGTTDSAGAFSQVLDSTAQYSFSVTPNTATSGFQYTDVITIPYVGVPGGGTLNMGTIGLPNKAGQADPEVDQQAMTLPSQCTATPASGAPIIVRAIYTDAKKGSFLYAGNNAGVTVYADKPGYTVRADYSLIEGQQPNALVVTATDNGDGTYTANHTVALTTQGGGLVIISATNASAQTTTACTPPGPVNLNIRSFFNGSQTTNFAAVGADANGDFRALQNFTMHQDGIVKVTFTKPVNMLDPSVQNFMKAIAKKMISAKGKVSLDAKAVLELKNSGAAITMYNVPDYLSSPTILLDGSDPGSAVSGVTYDRTSHSITFSAAHFSQYTVVPTLTVTAPTDKTTTSDTKVTVKGSVNDTSSTVTISIGGTDQGTITVNSDGTFSQDVSLAMGDNTIVVNASNSVGSAIGTTLTVTRQKLPATGASGTTLLTLVGLLVAGITLYVIASRLRYPQAQS